MSAYGNFSFVLMCLVCGLILFSKSLPFFKRIYFGKYTLKNFVAQSRAVLPYYYPQCIPIIIFLNFFLEEKDFKSS